MQPFTPRGHGMRTYTTPLCMRLVLPGKGRGRVGCEALQEDRRTVNMHVEPGRHTRTTWSFSAEGVLYQSTEEYTYSFRDYESHPADNSCHQLGGGGVAGGLEGGGLGAD